jgi:hypothetical protein
MKTIRIKIYEFNELSEAAKQTAIENYKNNNLSFDFIYSDAENTVEAFCDAFNVKTGRNSWLDCNTSNIEDNILNLTGLRLRKYLLNNFGSILYKRKYLKTGENLDSRPTKYHRMQKITEIQRGLDKGKFYITYYSNLFVVSNDCNLTGMCYDNDMMGPMYDFLELRTFDSTNFEDLLNSCFYEMKRTLENEEEYMYSDEYISEEIENNDWQFTENGQIFN